MAVQDAGTLGQSLINRGSSPKIPPVSFGSLLVSHHLSPAFWTMKPFCHEPPNEHVPQNTVWKILVSAGHARVQSLPAPGGWTFPATLALTMHLCQSSPASQPSLTCPCSSTHPQNMRMLYRAGSSGKGAICWRQSCSQPPLKPSEQSTPTWRS